MSSFTRLGSLSTAFSICLLCSVHTYAHEVVFPPVLDVGTAESSNYRPALEVQINQNQDYARRVSQEQVTENPKGVFVSATSGDAAAGISGVDSWSETIFAGLTTFGNTPWQPCLSTASQYESQNQPYDIAFLGAPFDTSTTGRPGARFGPSGIRRGSQRIYPHAAWDPYTHQNSFLDWARIVDCGDAPLTFLDNTVALKQLGHAHKLVAGRTANATDQSSVPRIIVLGGDHTTTLAALRNTKEHWGRVSVLHFDSHIDTWDPKVLGGGLSSYAGLNHGTFLHIAHEEGLLLNDTNMHAGIRAPVSNPKHDWKNDKRCGFGIITARDIDRIGVQGVIEKIKARVGDTKVYISVDIDVLDPAYAPGTGTAEVGGWTTRELLSILDGLEGLKVIGADVVEVAPAYDNMGETTLLAAAEVAHTLMTLMVATSVTPLKDLEQDLKRS